MTLVKTMSQFLLPSQTYYTNIRLKYVLTSPSPSSHWLLFSIFFLLRFYMKIHVVTEPKNDAIMTYRKETTRLHAFVMTLIVQLHSSASTRRKLLSISRTTGGVGSKVGLNTVEEKVSVRTANRKPVVHSEPVHYNN
jgi:hypothetical protein